MSKDTKDLSTSAHSINSDDEGYVYISMTDPNHKGIWMDPAEFVWVIGDYGRNIILAGFLSHEFSPSEIATVFRKGKFHTELSNRHGQIFVCNTNDIVNAHVYMAENGNVRFQQRFNEGNRKEWEKVPELSMEVTRWIQALKKGTFLLLVYVFVVFDYRFLYKISQELTRICI